MHGTTRINLPTITFFTCLCLFQSIHLNFLMSHVAPSQGYAYPVHYTVLFHNLGGYYNSLKLQALEIPPEWHQAGDEKKLPSAVIWLAKRCSYFKVRTTFFL